MARVTSGIKGRTPTGRNVNDYMGRPPRASGTGPKNLAKNAAQATSQVRAGRPKASVASMPRSSAALASGGSGGNVAINKSPGTSPIPGPATSINKPKTGPPKRA